jgi:hypothetical protein
MRRVLARHRPALMSAVSPPWPVVSLVSLACHWLAHWHGSWSESRNGVEPDLDINYSE